MSSRDHPFSFHSGQSDMSAKLTIDLGFEYEDIVRIRYYNRRDCCQERGKGVKIEILNPNLNILYKTTISYSFTNHTDIYIPDT